MIRLYLLFILLCSTSLSHGQGSAEAKKLYQKGVHFLSNEQKDSSEYYFEQFLQLVHQHEPAVYAKNLIHLATLHRQALEFDAAMTYFDQVLITPTNKEDSITLVDFYSEKGLLYYDQSLYALSLLELTKSLEIAHLTKDSIGLSIAYLNTGNIFKDIQDYSMAEEYYEKSKDYASHYPYFKTKALNNLGSIFLEQGNLLLAEQYLQEALALAITNVLPTDHVDALINLAIIAVKRNQLSEAQPQFEKAVQISDSLGNLSKTLLCAVNLYHIHTLKNDSDKASYYEELSLQLVDKVSVPAAEVELYGYLNTAYAAQNDLNKAYHYLKLLLETKESIYHQQSMIQDLQLKFKLEYQQALIQLQSLEDELNTERVTKEEALVRNDRLSSQNLWIILLSLIAVVLLVAILFILMRANRKKGNYLKSLAQRSQELSQKNEEIINSKEYAHSMERLLIQQMNPHFIFNCLTTIEASIEIGEVKYAKEYLVLFSSLLRKTLDSSRVTSVPLMDEINFLKEYIDFSQLKQESQFDYQFIYDEEEVNDFVNTPPMLIQPFVENAIFHGLYHKTTGSKKLTVIVEPRENVIVWTIIDNGVGRKKTAEIKKLHPGVSHGTKITSDRILWMQNFYQQQLSIVYEDLAEGTKVTIHTPILED